MVGHNHVPQLQEGQDMSVPFQVLKFPSEKHLGHPVCVRKIGGIVGSTLHVVELFDMVVARVFQDCCIPKTTYCTHRG